MSSREIYADDARSDEKPRRRFVIILLAVLLAACVLTAAAYFIAKQRAARVNKSGAQNAAATSSNEAQPAAIRTCPLSGDEPALAIDLGEPPHVHDYSFSVSYPENNRFPGSC